jgi:hypothetical protein
MHDVDATLYVFGIRLPCRLSDMTVAVNENIRGTRYDSEAVLTIDVVVKLMVS